MATAHQIKALVQCHFSGDDARFRATVAMIAANEEAGRSPQFGKDLREILSKATTRMALSALDSRAQGFLAEMPSTTRLADLALSEPICAAVGRVVAEYRERERLRAHGFDAARKVLLVGPPGTGKTSTASAIAAEVGLPLILVRTEQVVDSHMGCTARNLSTVFEAVVKLPAVYLFDEYDAIAGSRETGESAGRERAQTVTSLLQFLERDRSDSVLVSCTNRADHLDGALFRRFDAVITYNLPTDAQAMAVMRARLSTMETSAVDWPMAAYAARGLSHAEIGSACAQVAKDALIQGSSLVTQDGLTAALASRQR